MKSETDTVHRGKVNGVVCRGTIMVDLSQSRLSKAFGNREYKCDKCGQKWCVPGEKNGPAA